MKRSIVVTFLLAVAGLLTAVPGVFAHEDSSEFLSELRGLQPTVNGLGVNVVERDDAMRLTNQTGKTVSIPGYEGEPYLRLLPGGKVEVNVKSPARYLNQDRFAQTAIPKGVSEKAPPVWRRVGRNGEVVWHDHRIHWMGKTTPPQVKNEALRTKIFDWKVPVLVGQRRVQVVGTLYWDPGKPPAAAASKFNATPYAIGGVLLVLVLGVLGGLYFRRRQQGGGGPDAEASAESW